VWCAFCNGTANEITIRDTTPEAFQALLRYLYTDELRFDDEHLVDVMRKARAISLERVYNHGMRQVRQNMSVNDVVAWLVKADEYGLEDVRTAAFGFLARNLDQVKAQVRILNQGSGQSSGKNPQPCPGQGSGKNSQTCALS
jgi:hypothetical protein